MALLRYQLASFISVARRMGNITRIKYYCDCPTVGNSIMVELRPIGALWAQKYLAENFFK